MSLAEQIERVSSEFLREARQSPVLLADMAAMEKYLTESYDQRMMVELLQNADDCGSTRVAITQDGNDLYFANNGTPFDESDIRAICRSGSSGKERGKTIGYRGVGFKSTTSASDDILIYSNDTNFSFSKALCAKQLGVPKKNVPTVRIPFLLPALDDRVAINVDSLVQSGFTTVFVFRDAAKHSRVLSEIKKIDTDLFLFLRHVSECSIDLTGYQKSFQFTRTEMDYGYLFAPSANSNDKWRVVGDSATAIAFKERDGIVIQCDREEAVFHSCLPTLDRTPIRAKINGDFSTDPSRKHITEDSFTRRATEQAADIAAGIIKHVLTGEDATGVLEGGRNFLSVLNGSESLAPVSSAFSQAVQDRVKQIEFKDAGENTVTMSELRSAPQWLEPAEVAALKRSSDALSRGSLPNRISNNYSDAEAFVRRYSHTSYKTDEVAACLSDQNAAETVAPHTIAKIIAHGAQESRTREALRKEPLSIENATQWLTKTSGNKKTKLVEALRDECSDADLQYLEKKTGAKLIERQDDPKPQPKKQATRGVHVTRWRSAEQQAIEVEKYLGYNAVDVSKQNLGYDIESTAPKGDKRYVEVKSLQRDDASFTITNNEYTAAHTLGDDYFLCLMTPHKAIYIQNPLENLHFDRRVRQYEWVCDEYAGDEILLRED